MDKKLIDLLDKLPAPGLLKWFDEKEIAAQTGIPERELEDRVLGRGIIPLRYLRNIGTIKTAEQQILLNSRAAVIGCGGLGGSVLEQLARLGIGNLIGWDLDVFEEHNLNRQILSDIKNIGANKIDAARARLKAINPAVVFHGILARFEPETGKEILTGCHVVIDALDNIEDRLQLSALCRELKIPLVHGAVEGWVGQLTTQFPGETVIEKIYARAQNHEKQRTVSTPVFTPALVASLQVAETVKILLGRGELLRNRIMLVNLLDMDMDVIELRDD